MRRVPAPCSTSRPAATAVAAAATCAPPARASMARPAWARPTARPDSEWHFARKLARGRANQAVGTGATLPRVDLSPKRDRVGPMPNAAIEAPHDPPSAGRRGVRAIEPDARLLDKLPTAVA